MRLLIIWNRNPVSTTVLGQPYMGQRLFQERENNVRADKTIVRLRYPGRDLKKGGGGGSKNFLLLKKRKNFDP